MQLHFLSTLPFKFSDHSNKWLLVSLSSQPSLFRKGHGEENVKW